MIPGAQYDRIDDRGLHITVNGEQKVLEVDNVVICAGRETLKESEPKFIAHWCSFPSGRMHQCAIW